MFKNEELHNLKQSDIKGHIVGKNSFILYYYYTIKFIILYHYTMPVVNTISNIKLFYYYLY